MKKLFGLCLIFLVAAVGLFADQYQVVRTETFDGQGKLLSISWQDWDYYSKDILLVYRAGNTAGQEFIFKYVSDSKFANPFKKMVYIVKDADASKVKLGTPNATTVYNYNTAEMVTLEITTFDNGDRESIVYIRDNKNRVTGKQVDSIVNKAKTTVAYKYDYQADNATVITGDNGTVEKLSYDAKGYLKKDEITKNGKVDRTDAFQYDERLTLVGKTTTDAAGNTVTKEKYTYGVYKPRDEVKTNVADWLTRYANNTPALEIAITKYYPSVARNAQYNDLLRYSYYLIGTGYFKKEKYDAAIQYYKKSLAFGKSNVAGSEDIQVLRKYFYTTWDIAASKNNGPEYYSAYNIACCLSRLNKWDEGLAWLDFAFQIGFNDMSLMADDPDLEYLKLMKEDDVKQIKDRTWKQ